MSHEKLYLRPAELAERWSISVKKLANDRCKRQGVSYVKVGQAVLYAIADVEEYERRGRVETEVSSASGR